MRTRAGTAELVGVLLRAANATARERAEAPEVEKKKFEFFFF
jgi:hypothetical protein